MSGVHERGPDEGGAPTATAATSAPTALSARIAEVLAIDPSAPAIEFAGAWRAWGELAATVDAVAALVPAPGAEIGVILRNRPAHVGAVLGILRAGGCVVTINPHRGEARTRDDIAGLPLDVLVGTTDDLATFVTDSVTATLVALDDLGAGPTVTAGTATTEPSGEAGVAIRMLTSGTTGPPKRIELTYATMERVLLDAKHYEKDKGTAARLRSGVAVVNSPLVHLGGLFRILQCVNDGRSFALLERFTVDGWYEAVRRHRPATASLVPAALRMVLEADLDPEELSSLRSIISGTAPLSPDDADAFYEKYGVPVLISYAATELGGGVAGWNLRDHERFWKEKRGSVGRVHPGSELRVVDEETGDVLGPDEPGLLEIKASQLGRDSGWVHTTDLARIDGDGFLYILGRADQAIIRGGFKVLPDTVRAAIEANPAVRGASVVGIDDRRLGAVPVAAVELKDGHGEVTAEDLIDELGTRLAPYEVPTAITIVDELPRTDSGKVDLMAIRALFASIDEKDWSSGVEGR